MRGIRKIFAFLILGFAVTMVGCSEKVEDKDIKGKTLNDGAIINKINGEIENLNFKDNSYKKENLGEGITNYANENSYVFLKNGKHEIYYKGKILEIKDEKYSDLKLSKDGEYLSYMVYKDGYNLKVLDLSKNKPIELKMNVKISGNFFDFLKNDALVYYGVSEKLENGIFTYSLKTGEEKLLYKLEKGYIEYLDYIKDEVIVVINEGNSREKTLKAIPLKSEKPKILSNKIEKIKNVIKNKEGYYLLGCTTDDGDSLYKIKGDKIERITYDFPKKVYIEGGIELVEEEIFFIGYGENEGERDIYSFNGEEIKLITRESGEYTFVKKE